MWWLGTSGACAADLWAAGTFAWYEGAKVWYEEAKVSGLHLACCAAHRVRTDQSRFFNPNLLADLPGGDEHWVKDCSLSQSHQRAEEELVSILSS